MVGLSAENIFFVLEKEILRRKAAAHLSPLKRNTDFLKSFVRGLASFTNPRTKRERKLTVPKKCAATFPILAVLSW